MEVLAPHPDSFIKLVVADLVWLFCQTGKDYGMPDPRQSLQVSVDWIASSQPRWKKLLVRSRLAHSSFFGLNAYGRWWTRMKLKECDSRAFPLMSNVDPHVDASGQWYKCWCSFTCSSFAKLCLHAANKHGHRQNSFAYLNDNGSCRGCLKVFHNRRRPLRHLTDQKG